MNPRFLTSHKLTRADQQARSGLFSLKRLCLPLLAAVSLLGFAAAAPAATPVPAATPAASLSPAPAAKTPLQAVHASKKALASMTSFELSRDMGLGWNLGNTLDVCAADRDGDGVLDESPETGKVVDETLWGNIRTQGRLFDQLVADGFGAVRIPITWRDHLNADDQVDPAWMNRVQEVVDMALARGLYVIINVHHDGGGDPDNGAWVQAWAMDDWDRFNTRFTRLWTQIATRFASYDEHLVFEDLNEVGFDDLGKDDAYSMLNKINQIFVDLIRSSGGKNKVRHLMVAGLWTDIEKTATPRFQMPKDPAGRLMLSLHYYTPWQFCVSDSQHYWGSDGDIRTMEFKVRVIKKDFIEQGIPVVIGEYGTHPANDAANRVKFCGNFVRLCTALGVPTFLWDNGEVLNRETLTWRLDGLIPAIRAGAGL